MENIDILENLNEEQVKNGRTVEGPVLVLAGAEQEKLGH